VQPSPGFSTGDNAGQFATPWPVWFQSKQSCCGVGKEGRREDTTRTEEKTGESHTRRDIGRYAVGVSIQARCGGLCACDVPAPCFTPVTRAAALFAARKPRLPHLPHGWRSAQDMGGRTYYYHAVSVRLDRAASSVFSNHDHCCCPAADCFASVLPCLQVVKKSSWAFPDRHALIFCQFPLAAPSRIAIDSEIALRPTSDVDVLPLSCVHALLRDGSLFVLDRLKSCGGVYRRSFSTPNKAPSSPSSPRTTTDAWKVPAHQQESEILMGMLDLLKTAR